MRTISERVSETAIRRFKAKDVRQITCTKYPLKFRYHKDRDRGSWHLVTYRGGKTHWRKVANWPEVKAPKIIEILPDLIAEITKDPSIKELNAMRFATIAELLQWYLARSLEDANTSSSRKNSVRTIVKNHLIPHFGDVMISEITADLIDEKLLWPLQKKYSVSYVRQIYDVLRIAFNQARKLKMVKQNPMAEMKFSDSVKAKIKPKDSRITPAQLWQVAEQVKTAPMMSEMLVTMLLANGTRIGETRQARWDRFDFTRQIWIIPGAETKTGIEHTIPLTKRSQYMLLKYQKWQRRNGYNGVFLFPNKKGKPINERKASDMIKKVSNGQWSAHDLRKVARTMWATAGVDSDVAELLLNHSLDRVKKTYMQTRMEEFKRSALEAHHNELVKEGFKFLRLHNKKALTK